MKQINQTTAGIKAINWLQSQRIYHEFNWEKPTKEDFAIWERMKAARALVDKNGQECRAINEYGPNPSGITKPGEINRMYLSNYSSQSDRWSA